VLLHSNKANTGKIWYIYFREIKTIVKLLPSHLRVQPSFVQSFLFGSSDSQMGYLKKSCSCPRTAQKNCLGDLQKKFVRGFQQVDCITSTVQTSAFSPIVWARDSHGHENIRSATKLWNGHLRLQKREI